MARENTNRESLTPEQTRKTLGANLNFAAMEAYKLLRTNLEFSLPAGDGCRILGVTSAMKGEGKSTTSVNTAFTLAQTGRKVLLLEADLRLPTVAKRLRVHAKPGLSNLMVGQCTGSDALQKSGLNPNLWVVTAGDVPPNPAELLGSKPMEVILKTFSEYFDVIVVDLPPVTVVSDALIISKYLDGVVLVVRQNYCDRGAVEEAVRQLRFADAKLLGFIMTGADTQKKAYKQHYGGYGDYGQSASQGSGNKA